MTPGRVRAYTKEMAGPESTGTEVTMFMVLWQRLRHFWNSCTPQALVDKFFQMWQIHLQSEFDEFGVPFFRAYSRMKILGGITTPWRFFGQCSLDLGARPIRNHTYKDRKMYSMWGRTMMKPGLFGVSFFHVSSTQQAGYPQSYDNTNKSQAVGSPSGERSRPPAPPPPTHTHTHTHTRQITWIRITRPAAIAATAMPSTRDVVRCPTPTAATEVQQLQQTTCRACDRKTLHSSPAAQGNQMKLIALMKTAPTKRRRHGPRLMMRISLCCVSLRGYVMVKPSRSQAM